MKMVETKLNEICHHMMNLPNQGPIKLIERKLNEKTKVLKTIRSSSFEECNHIFEYNQCQ